MTFGRKRWRVRAMLLAGALLATASAAHDIAGRADPAPSSQEDKDAKKQHEKEEKARRKEEKAQRKDDEKKEKEKRKTEKREAKQREKKERAEAKERRKHGEPGPVPVVTPPPVPTPEPPRPPVFTATPGLAPRDRLARTVDLLQQGQEGQARAELAQLLSDQPDSREARALQTTLDTDPQALFGAESFAYTVGPHDSLITLAIAFFGDSYKFYGLARYNHLSVPANVHPGDTILIPGHPRAPTVRRAPREEERGPAPTPVATPEPPRAVPVQPRSDPARAQRLRRAGLERMSGGSIDQAVSLLEAAIRLDPGNAAIAADLNRARRIQAVVHRH